MTRSGGLGLRVCACAAGAILALVRGGDAPAGFDELVPSQIAAVEKGAKFLSKAQSSDGSFGQDAGQGAYRMAMTGLAGMALLSAGHTPGRGQYGRNVQRALKFVLKNQQRDGLLTTQNDGQSMYGHGFSMTFLAEAYGMDVGGEDSAKIRETLTRAVKLTAKAQSSWGGWYYSPDSGNDEGSVTITQVQALRACANTGIPVPQKTMDNALKYIHKSQNSDGGIRYTARDGGGSSVALSAAGAELLLMAGQYQSKETKKVVDYLKKNLDPRQTQGYHDFYTNFYGAQAMAQIGRSEPATWQRYYKEMRNRLVKSQSGNGSWSGDIGATYCTAIGVMILSIPYQYLPIFQK